VSVRERKREAIDTRAHSQRTCRQGRDVEARPVPTDGEVENEEKGVLKLASAVDSIGDICRE
jgi:hypothetical protein